MAFKIDAGKSFVPKIIKPKLPEPQQVTPQTFSPTDNGSVLNNRATNDYHAKSIKSQLTANFFQTQPPAIVAQQAIVEPTLTQQQVEQRAEEIIDNNGGKDNLNTDDVGRDLAEIAIQNPADAWLVTQEILGTEIDQDGDGNVKENDKDEIAQSFVESLEQGEINDLARDQDGRQLLERMQTHLLTGSVHNDEIDTSDKITAALSEFSTFSESSQGIHPMSDLVLGTSPGMALDTSATPEEAAAGMKANDLYGGYNNEAGQVQAFTDQLEAHQDDPEWIQQYYSALGSEKAAELISLANTPSGYSNFSTGMSGSDAAADAFVERNEIIRDSLETLISTDQFSQADMNILVDSMVENRTNPNVAVEIFGKSDNPELQEMFVRAAVDNGNNAMDASASHVLANMSVSDQSRILSSFSRDGKLNDFIQGSMASEGEILNLENFLRTGTGHETVNFGGVEQILENATTQEDLQYPPYIREPYNHQLQRDIFNAVSYGLTDNNAYENFENNPDFKDDLSTLFIRHTDKLLHDAQVNSQGENSGTLFANPDFQLGLEKFFQLSLLSSPPGEKYEDTAVAVFQLINEGVTALDNPDLANRDQGAFDDFVRTHGGIEPTQYANLIGEVLGSMLDATGFAREDINADEAARQQAIDLYLGLATSMIPGVGSKIASNVTNEIFKQFVSKTGDFLTTQAKNTIEDGLSSIINGQFDNDDRVRQTDLTNLVNQIFYEGLSTLPNGSSIDGDSNRDQYDFQGDILDGFLASTQFSRVDN